MPEDTNTAAKVKLQYELDLEARGFSKNPETEIYEKDRGDGLKYVANVHDSAPLIGLVWTSLEPKANDQVALDALIAKFGVSKLLVAATAQFRNSQRNKAKNSKLPAEISDEAAAAQRMRDPIYFKEEDVDKWVPGERETTIAGYNKLIAACLDTIKDPKVSVDDKKATRARMRELIAAREDLTLREADAACDASE